MREFLDFEQPLKEIEAKLEDLELFGKGSSSKKETTLANLRKKREKIVKEIYGRLTPWQTVKVARHPNRPYTLDYINNVFTDFQEIHGDRYFADDPAIVTGFARRVGTQSSRSTGILECQGPKDIERLFG